MFATFFHDGRALALDGGSTSDELADAVVLDPSQSLRASRYNAVYDVDGERAVVMNTISGAADVIDASIAEALKKDQVGKLHVDTRRYLAGRGYLWRSEHDELRVIHKLGEGTRDSVRRRQPLKLLLIPTYRCNLSCTYCWQQPFVKEYYKDSFDEAMTASAFSAMLKLEEMEKDRTAYTELQLFGGEPLLPAVRPLVERAVQFAAEHGWALRITTNGMGLADYLELFAEYPPAEVQITVDGPPEMLRLRRRGADFEKIARGIEGLLFYGQTLVNLRVNLDAANLETLPDLANILIDRRWFTNPKFYAYVAPTRDEHFDKRDMYDNRAPMLARYVDLVHQHPQLEIFNVRGWNGFGDVQHLEQQGVLPRATFHSCDANLNMFVFDARGMLYACNEANGREDRSIGRFHPDLEIDESALAAWRTPAFLQREGCQTCSLMPLCGGGCMISTEGEDYHAGYCEDVKSSFEFSLVDLARRRLAT